jgi:hypothetical protein
MFYRLPEEETTLENEPRFLQEVVSTCGIIKDQGMVATAQLLRDRLPRFDRCMRPLHHLIWSGCLAIAIYCPAHYGAVWGAWLFKISFLFSLFVSCCFYLWAARDQNVGPLLSELSPRAYWWCLPAIAIGTPFVFISLTLLWPAVMLTAALLCVLYLSLPVSVKVLRRYGYDTIPDTVLYLVLTPLFALLACSRFWGRLIRRTRGDQDGIPLH